MGDRHSCFNPAILLHPFSRGLHWCAQLKFIVCRAVLLTMCVVALVVGTTSTSKADELLIDASSIQPSIEQNQPARSGLDADDISSEKVNQFVKAYSLMMSLNEAREEDLQGAETEPEFLRVQQEMETEVVAIIQTAGLTWQEFLQLWDLANIDPEFGERIATQLQEAKDSL